MLSRYKDTKEWQISITDLKERLSLIDKKTGRDKYPIYGLFRAKVLDVAQKELKEHADIQFTYEAKKTGRKYSHLFFKIRSNATSAPIEKPQEFKRCDESTQEKYPHPDLSGDALKQYLYLTRDVRWLDKKMAYKVVQAIPSGHLGEFIYRYQIMVKRGNEDRPHAKNFFEQVLDRFSKKPDVLNPTWSNCYHRMCNDFGFSAIIVQRLKKELMEKTTPKELLALLERIPEEIQKKGMPAEKKKHYLKGCLAEKYDLTL